MGGGAAEGGGGMASTEAGCGGEACVRVCEGVGGSATYAHVS